MYIYIYAYIYICIHAYIYAYVYIYIIIYIRIFKYAHTYIYMYINIHIYIHMYTYGRTSCITCSARAPLKRHHWSSVTEHGSRAGSIFESPSSSKIIRVIGCFSGEHSWTSVFLWFVYIYLYICKYINIGIYTVICCFSGKHSWT